MAVIGGDRRCPRGVETLGKLLFLVVGHRLSCQVCDSVRMLESIRYTGACGRGVPERGSVRRKLSRSGPGCPEALRR